jgi:hypothetical protein
VQTRAQNSQGLGTSAPHGSSLEQGPTPSPPTSRVSWPVGIELGFEPRQCGLRVELFAS